MKGFYVLGSRSGSYVANKQNEEGSYKYDAEAIGLGIQKQAALQDLSKQYEQTINNAYASYLANQKGIAASQMGQGYKEAYEQKEQDILQQNIAQLNQNAQSVRAQLQTQEIEARNKLQQQYEAEVGNLDRVAQSMDDYLVYVKSLTKDGTENTESYLTPEQSNKSIDELYDILYSAQPQSYRDTEGEAGLSYSQWLNKQLKDTTADREWSKWLYGGGWQDFRTSVAKNLEKQIGKEYESRVAQEQYDSEFEQTVNRVRSQMNTRDDVSIVLQNINISNTDAAKDAFAKALKIDKIELNKTIEASDGKKYIIIQNADGTYTVINQKMSGMVTRI